MLKLNKKISPFSRKIIEGTFLLTVGNVLSRALLAVAYVYLARILTAKQNGEYGMLKSTIDNFYTVASMGIGLTATKYISEYKDSNKEEASSILGTSLVSILFFGIVIVAVLFGFSDYIAQSVLHSSSLSTSLILVGVIIVFASYNEIQNGALLGLQSFKKIAQTNVLQGFMLFLGLCVGGYFYGVLGAIIGNLISVISANIIIHFFLHTELKKNELKLSVKNWKVSLIKMARFAIPASLSTFIAAPAIWVLNTKLVGLPNGYAELGLYSAVAIFSVAIQMLNGSINRVLLPIFLSKESQANVKSDFFNYFGTWIISLLIVIPFIIFPEIASYILGHKYPEDKIIWVLNFTLFSALIIAHRQGISRDLVMKNKMWLSVFSMGQWAITTFVVFLYLKNYGAVGFAASFCIGYVSNSLLFFPMFIYLKICESRIFFNMNMFFCWVIIIAFMFVNSCFDNILYRLSISFVLLALLVMSVIQLYKKYVSVN